MKSGERQKAEGVEPSNQERIRTLREKENYQYFGILEASAIKQVQVKEKIRKSYLKESFLKPTSDPENSSKN